MDIQKNSSLKFKSNYSMSEITTDNNLNLGTLKTFNCQNVTSILNNPEFSFFDEIKYKISKFRSNDKSNESELLSSVYSSSPRSSKSANPKSFKSTQITETFDEYCGKIEKCYSSFKRNHYTKSIFGASHSHNHTNPEPSAPSTYSKTKIVIPSDYLKTNYKINDRILNLSFEELFCYSEELTEKCGDLGYEMDKILLHSNKLFKYIMENYDSFDKTEMFLSKVKKFKQKNKILKEKILVNSIATIKNGIKKSNYQKIVNIIDKIKNLQNNILKMNALIEENNINLFFELYNTSLNTIESISKKRSNKLIAKVKEDLENTYEKIANKLYGQLIQFSKDQLSNTICFSALLDSQTKNINWQFFTEKFIFDLTIFRTSNLEKILQAIDLTSIFDETVRIKLKEILNFVYQVDFNSLMKMRTWLRKIFNEEIYLNIEKLKVIFIELYQKPEKTDIFPLLDILDQSFFFFLVTRILHMLFSRIEELLDNFLNESLIILKQKSFSIKEIDQYEKQYYQEIVNIKSICVEDMYKIVEMYMTVHMDKIMTVNINQFMKNYVILLMFTQKYSFFNSNPNHFNKFFFEIQENYIISFFSKRHSEINNSIEAEEWKEVNISPSSQNMLNFIIKNSKTKLKSKTLEIIEKLEALDENQQATLESLEISDEKYKLIQSLQGFLVFVFETEKMLYFFDPSLFEIITQKLTKIIKDYTAKCSNLIIGGEAFKLKKLTINQKNICVVISSLLLLYETVLCMLSNNMSSDDDEIEDSNTSKNPSLAVFLFQDLVEHINGLVLGGRKKLLDLSLDSINSSFQIFNTIDWKNEQLASIKEKIEKLFNRQKTVATIYTAMNNYLPNSFKDNIIPEVIKSLISNYNSSLENMSKIENKNAGKQFRVLMDKTKKLIEVFKLPDANNYFSILDEYISNYAPRPKTEKNDE